jgi:hypothetical protein
VRAVLTHIELDDQSGVGAEADAIERSHVEQKRQLIAFVFSNLRLRGKKLEFASG